MPTYRVTAPDGTKFKVNAPEGATESEVMAYAQSQFKTQPKEWEGSSNQEIKPFSGYETLKNVPGSALNFAKGLVGAAIHPMVTLTSMADLGAGALRNLAPGPVRSAVDSVDPNPQAAERASGVANAVGENYAKRYGGLENIKQTVMSDPVGVAADASTVLGIGGAVAPGKVGQALNTASKYTNPLSVIPPVVKGTGKVGQQVLGLTTGVGAENIAQAAKSGAAGNKDFLRNLTGQEQMTSVLDRAKQGLETMRAQKSADYRVNMATVSGDKAILNFDGIDKAIGEAAKVVAYKGQVKNPTAAAAVQSMADDVASWKALDPADFHTPEGLDALKQRLGSTLESIPYNERAARLAAGKVYDSVKTEIQKQAPTYAKTMKSYSEASEQIGEIERALSLGDKAAKDTAMRKLQSLSRNNVNTNYGNRLDLARQLESGGGVDLMPSIAGQAMNSWAARGLGGQAENLATLGLAAFHNPMLAAALPFQSPKAVGASLYGLGRVAGGARSLLGRSGVTPSGVRLGGLLAEELGPKDW